MSATITLKIGKYYRDRLGNVRGPMEHFEDSTYPFSARDETRRRLTWTEQGYFISPFRERSEDLIAEHITDGTLGYARLLNGKLELMTERERIAELEKLLEEKTNQWLIAKNIAVKQGYHKARADRAEKALAELKAYYGE